MTSSAERPLCRRIWAALTIAVMTVALLALVTPAARAGEPETVTVETSLLQGFSPSPLEIATGTTVVWRNAETLDYPVIKGSHQIAWDDGSVTSPLIAVGAQWGYTFLNPGTLAYHCAVHAIMKGMVTISGDPVPPAAVPKTVAIVERDAGDPETWGYEPPDLTIPIGTKVTWRNDGTTPHSVAFDDGSAGSGEIAQGKTWSRTFSSAAGLTYHCAQHPWMKGTLGVAEPGQAAPTPTPAPSSTHTTKPGVTVAVRQPARAGQKPATLHVHMVEPSVTQPAQWRFDPDRLGVRAKDTVIWTNAGAAQHSVTADDGSFDSGLLAPGETFSRAFDHPMIVRFHCTPHPWMKGTIEVASAIAVGPISVPSAPATSVPEARETVPATVQAAPAPVPTMTSTSAPTGATRGRTAGIVVAALLAIASMVALASSHALGLAGSFRGWSGRAVPTQQPARVSEPLTLEPLRIDLTDSADSPAREPLRIG